MVTVPLAPRTARAIGLAIGERTEGPVFLARDGRRLDRYGAGGLPQDRPPRRDRQAGHAAHAAACVYYCRAGRRGAAARCPGSRLARGPRTTMR